jgi:hypothetical protein
MIGCGKKKLIFFKFLNDLSTYGFHTRAVPCRAVPCRTASDPHRTAPRHRFSEFVDFVIFQKFCIDEIEILANFFRIF